ncbi:glutathione ABC transporter substrate-binding protein [Deinococcus humi]|uniref:Peptide/nickel transport system substrate-binding protein n=1 Tax=Deinococcus humi TaxID=662880 RepID=A0A7W8JV88_9DEIO|nr:glutathione ABC transporter substrate-binding protein [Deinococcus humi]MBB5363769.1 peptide/nickel transport system substrate-binding protein [Deinococcus humi]GGO32063.1 glutathione ABC transporter substrate-binding protein [Deinococcus humi]
MKRLTLALACFTFPVSLAGAQSGTVTIATTNDAPTLDPNMTFSGLAFGITNHIYDSLLAREEDGSIKPRLATSWKRINATTWRFELRKNVKFQDGTPFNAAAVKFSVERLIAPESKAPGGYVLNMIKTIKVIDDDTIEFVTADPFAPLLAHLTHPVTAIVSPGAVKAGGKDFARNPVGTGPFKFSKWNTGNQIELVANPNYWGGKVGIQKLVFRIIPDVSTQVVELKTGRVDLITTVPPESYKELDADKNLSVFKKLGWGTTYLGFNTQSGITKNARVRQAISQAIDRDMIVNVLRQGLAVKATAPIPPTVYGAGKNLPGVSYNLNAAKALLAQAGVKPGTKITLATYENAENRQLAEAIQFSLQQLGFNAAVQITDYGTYSTNMQKPNHAELFISGWGTVTLDADYALYALFSSKEIPVNNWSFYKNVKVDKLLLDARRSSDQPKRLALYQDAQEQIHKDMPWLTLYYPLTAYAKTNRLQGEDWRYSWINLDLSKATVK